MTLDRYIEEHIDAEPPHLRALYRATHLGRLYPRMCTDHTQGRILAMLTRMISPRRILELGTFTGYSAICMAEAMPAGARLDTVEIDSDYTEQLRRTLDSSERGADIFLHTGDAEELIPRLINDGNGAFDMVFIDANKRRYCQYYQALLPALPSGAYILADNTLWDDKVIDPSAHDPQTAGIRAFNDMVAADPAVQKIILPVRDGLSVIRKI